MPFTKYVKLPRSERKPLFRRNQVGSCRSQPRDASYVNAAAACRRTQAALARQACSRRPAHQHANSSAANYGADPADIQFVGQFATANGLAVAQVNQTARTVVLTGRTADFAKAFQVELACYQHDGGSYRGRTGMISLPSELSKVVQSVHGLDDRPQAKPHFRLASRAQTNLAAAAVSYTALQVAQAYSFPSGLNGTGETIGIIELGGGFTQSDLRTYFSGLNISPAPSVVAVSVDGAQNQPTGDTSSPDTEVMLDIEVAGAVAPGASIVVYFTQIAMLVSWTPSIRL